jgi:superoxide dismutase, Fe-Mn family
MDARIQALPFDPAALRGLSEKLLTSHHRNNYGGAVKRLNAIRTRLAALPFSTAPRFQLNGLKREGSLVNQWVANHTHALAGGVPILALDMYEHS